MTTPKNSELGHIVRLVRQNFLDGITIEELADMLRPTITPSRGPSRRLSRAGLQRRETGITDLELSTFIMVLSLARLRIVIVNDDGRPIPPEYQLRDTPDRPLSGSVLLEMATNLQREVDRLVRMAELDAEPPEPEASAS